MAPPQYLTDPTAPPPTPTLYDCEHPYNQLRKLNSEAVHVRSLYEASALFGRAKELVEQTTTNLNARKMSLLSNAWFDEGGTAFGDEVNKSVRAMTDFVNAITSSGVQGQINHLSMQFSHIYQGVRNECLAYKDAYDKGRINTAADMFAYAKRAARYTIRLDEHYEAIAAGMRKFTDQAPGWVGPRAALAEPGNPNNNPDNPNGDPSSAAGTPAAAGAGDPASPGTPAEPETAPEPETPGTPEETTPSSTDQLTDALSAATSAMEAAESLLGGGQQLPDALPVDVPGVDVGDPYPYQPSLAGLEPAAFGGGALGGGAASTVGGAAVGSTTVTGPVTGGPGGVGAGLAPVAAAGLARGAASAAAATGGMPPMMPPGAGAAGAAGARQAGTGIKPGNSDRPVAEARPRPRRANSAVTPGVALTGRSGAAAPKPAARRSWDEENDSLQVLDEHLWQVNPPEEEPHGQDRRRPVRDGRDGTTAHRSPDARLAGPGGRADQPTRAR